jgi:Helix-loop-helix DNA-binding domain
MNLGEDWIDWTGKFDTAVPISSALDREIASNWDALDAYDPWAGAENECMVIEDLPLPQDHNFLSAHTDNNPSSSSLSFEEEKRLLRIAMPGLPPTSLSCLDPLLCNPKGEGPDPPISPPPSVSSSSATRTDKRKRKQPPTSRLRTHQSKGHNATERKYRNNLNSKLDILRLCVPSLCAASCTATVPSEKPPGVVDYDDNNSDNCSDGDGDGGAAGGGAKQRCTKATIIAKATAYILAQERDSKRLQADMVLCQSRIAAFEALEQAGVLWSSSSAARQRSAVGDV